jgi:transposase
LVRFFITCGQESDFTKGAALIEGFGAAYVVADKGYDSDSIVEAIESFGGEAVIPPRSHRKTPRAYNLAIYTARNLVERFFLKLKNFRIRPVKHSLEKTGRSGK